VREGGLTFGVWEETGERAYWDRVHCRHTAAFHAVGSGFGTVAPQADIFSVSAAAFDLTRQ